MLRHLKRLEEDPFYSEEEEEAPSDFSEGEEDDEQLSDFDEQNLDKEFELKSVEERIPDGMEPAKAGKLRKKLNRKQEERKQEMYAAVSKRLPHPNDRPRKSKYRYKQRTLVFASRGINQRMRHFMQDLRELLPHSKSEPKFEGRKHFESIKDICIERSCNNCVFLEGKRHTDLYMYLSRVPKGPSIKFLVSNVHTMAELRLTGNCLKGSRPMLIFDQKFTSSPALRLMKEVLFQVFGTPKAHPRSKPFVDHVFSFMLCDHKIWFRNYQLVFDADPNTTTDSEKEPRPILVEIGPRFVLHPIRITRGSFSSTTIYQDSHFVNPNAKRRALKRRAQAVSASRLIKEQSLGMAASDSGGAYLQKKMKQIARQKKLEQLAKLDRDPLKLRKVFTEGLNLSETSILERKKKDAKFKNALKKKKQHSEQADYNEDEFMIEGSEDENDFLDESSD